VPEILMKPPLGLALGHIEKEQSVENQICTKRVKFSDIAGVCVPTVQGTSTAAVVAT